MGDLSFFPPLSHSQESNRRGLLSCPKAVIDKAAKSTFLLDLPAVTSCKTYSLLSNSREGPIQNALMVGGTCVSLAKMS